MQQKKIPLVVPCPVNKTCPIEWLHSSCLSPIFLKGNGNLVCKEGCAEENICNWRFDYGHHQAEYRSINLANASIDALDIAIRSARTYFKNDKEEVLFLAGVQKNILV